MFELISDGHRATPHGDSVPLLLSSLLHGAGLAAVILVPLFLAHNQVPELPSMMAFVAAKPVAPPPPPPPPAALGVAKTVTVKPAGASNPAAAPVEAPAEITPEPAVQASAGAEGGEPGGVEGGVPGGVPGGVIGGIVSDVPPPPPPPPAAPAPAAPKAPVRVGGELQTPALVKRVGPEYPDLAVRAQLEGVVIIEAVVDQRGRVEDVHVLRSIPLLDNAAKAAVRQWEYSPLLLNGKAERFIVTVTVSFRLKRDS